MNPNPAPISLSLSEIRSMQPSQGFALASALILLGRPSDAKQALLNVEWTRLHARDLSRSISSNFITAASISLRIGDDDSALNDFLKQAASIDPSSLEYDKYDSTHCRDKPQELACSKAFDAAIIKSPAHANTLLAQAPGWICLHGDGENFFKQIDLMTPETIDAYLARAGFIHRLAQACANSAMGLGINQLGGFSPRGHLAMVHCATKALDQPGSNPGKTAFFQKLLAEIALLDQANPRQGPLLPDSWMPRLVLSQSPALRQAAFEAFGRQACLEELRSVEKQTHTAHLCDKAINSGSAESIAIALECFGKDFFRPETSNRFESPASARMISKLSPASFESAIAEISKAGLLDAFAEDCQAKFWAFQEHPTRKKGDALAFCVASAKSEHAQILLRALPSLQRRPAADMAAYMASRGVKASDAAHVAWEKILLSDTVDNASAEPAPAKARMRL